MEKLNNLKKIALETCKFRWHMMGAWEHGNHHSYGDYADSSCVMCGMDVRVCTKPSPNGIDISGNAVALTCIRPTSIDMKKAVEVLRDNHKFLAEKLLSAIKACDFLHVDTWADPIGMMGELAGSMMVNAIDLPGSQWFPNGKVDLFMEAGAIFSKKEGHGLYVLVSEMNGIAITLRLEDFELTTTEIFGKQYPVYGYITSVMEE